MVPIDKIIFLDGKVPIRTIQEPYCTICMNPVGREGDLCPFCTELPMGVTEWNFNRIIAIGCYKTHPNVPYNNISQNIISKIILILKGNVKKNKAKVGKLIADGLFQIIELHPFLAREKISLVIPPKNKKSEENQCTHFLKPLIKRLKKAGYDVENISNKLIRIKDIGKNKERGMNERFDAIKGVHLCKIDDLEGKNILILDDVITSKSTIWDLSRALKEKNAGKINALCIGRALIQDNDDFTTLACLDFSLEELITYFSNLDNFLEPKKIRDVNIKSYSLTNDELNCIANSYDISINFNNLVLKHNCTDFRQRRQRNKSFCKHITKLFIRLGEDYSEEKARGLLNNIYKNILLWEFKDE